MNYQFFAYPVISLSLLMFSCSQQKETQTEDRQVNTQQTADKQAAAIPPAGAEKPAGMVWIPAGNFSMGSDASNAANNEGPVHQVQISGFWMDESEVTNKEFSEFVDDTGYKTVAERPIDWNEMKKQLPPGTPKPADEVLAPGSLVFTPPAQAVPLDNYARWWSWTLGADWKHPQGPDSNIDGKDNFPVVHIAYEDAKAYADWAGKRLPTEAEWEYAARGGKNETPFAWGDELTPSGKYLANFYQGAFPYQNTGNDGFEGSAPVKSFPANSYGLYDMIGNVWEWSADWYRPDTYMRIQQAGMTVCKDPTGPESSYDPTDPYQPKRVIKGGSFLCSQDYCSNYRPSARMATSVDSGQNHLGFRCVKDI